LAVLTAGLAYLQIVLGSFVRHVSYEATVGAFQTAVVFHLVLAAVLTLHVGLLGFRTAQSFRDVRVLARPAYALAAMIVVQLGLGCAVWVANYGWPSWFAGYAWASQHVVQAEGTMQAHLATAHVALGSLILAVSVLMALRSCRLLEAKPVHRSAASALSLEVAV
jgi:cytochrome c oxidase assembly protein subunit 15